MPDSENFSEPSRTKRRKKVPRKITPTSLENAALYYLERFATSSENLRRVLLRRVERSAKHHDTDIEACAMLIEDLINRYQASGLLDDAVFARAQAASMNRRGKSVRAIRGHLMQKAVGADNIDKALKDLAVDVGDLDLAAAIAYAQKRRIGPYRKKENAPGVRDKELAALARNGFSYSLAQLIVDANNADELEQSLQ